MRLGRFVRLLFLAIWFGSLTGIVEIALVQMAVRGGLHVRLSADYVWMAPVANVFFAIAVTSVALCAARIRRGWDPAPTVLGVLSGLLILSIAGFLESLHRGAVLLLAAGIGSQMGRLARSPRTAMRLDQVSGDRQTQSSTPG